MHRDQDTVAHEFIEVLVEVHNVSIGEELQRGWVLNFHVLQKKENYKMASAVGAQKHVEECLKDTK